MLLGEVVDELLDEHRLAHAGAAKEAGLAAAHVGLQKVDGLDARLEDLGLGSELREGGRRMVDGVIEHVVGHGAAVHGLAHDVPHAAKRGLADGHHHRRAGVVHADAALEAVGRGHGDRPHHAARKLRLHLKNGAHVPHRGVGVDRERRVDGGHLLVKLHVHDGADDTHDSSVAHAPVHVLVRRLLQEGTAFGLGGRH